MLHRVVILLLLVLSFHPGMTQPGIDIKGSVTDSTGAALIKATVLLISGKDSLSELTREDGSYLFQLPAAGAIELLVSMKGYLPFRNVFALGKDIPLGKDKKSFLLEPVVLQADYRELEPVTVIRIRPVIIRGDTVDYNAAAFPVRDGSEVEDLLKRMPGIEVDAQGNVLVQGKKIGKVLVDGKEFFGGDVLLAIRNLPADIVEKIQVVDDYGDKARLTGVKSGDAQKVLNIVLQKDKRHGQFGQVEGGGGNQGKYLGHVSGNAFTGDRQLSADASLSNNSSAGRDLAKSLSLGYADRWKKKWEGNGNLSVSGDDRVQQGSSTQDNTYYNSKLHQEQSNQSDGSNRSLNAGFSLTHRPDSNSQLRITPSLNLQDSKQDALSTFSTREQDSGFVKTTNGNSHNQTTNHTVTGGVNGYFEKIAPHSRSRFSLSADLNYSLNNPFSDNQSTTTATASGITGITRQHYLVTNTNTGLTGGATVNYFAPLGKATFLELSYDWHSTRTANNKITRQTDSTHPQPALIDSLSNDYLFHSVTQRLHAGYISHVKKLDMTLILEAQPGSLDGVTSGKGTTQTYHYFTLLPTAQLAYAFSREKKLSFNYSGSTSPPSLQQLSPIEDLSNPQYPVTGNPALKPAVNQSLNLQYEQSALKPTQYSGFGLGLNYTSTQNMIITNLVHPRDTGAVIQRTTFLNANGSSTLQGNFHISFPAFLHKQLRITTDGTILNSQGISMVDSVLSASTSLTYAQGIHCNWNIPDKSEVDLSANYSHTSTRYHSGNQLSSQSSAVGWSLNNRHTFFKQWILNYSMSQSYTGSTGQGLQSNPTMLNAALQRQFLRKNRASIIFSAYDLLNQNSGAMQSSTPTSVTISHTALTGRYYMLSFQLKLQNFH